VRAHPARQDRKAQQGRKALQEPKARLGRVLLAQQVLRALPELKDLLALVS
jgi:hypothetical protein